MARGRGVLDPSLRYDESQKYVRCIPCAAAFPNAYGKKWIQYTSRNAHLSSSDHRNALAQIQAQERNQERLQEEHEALLQQAQTSSLQNPSISTYSSLKNTSVSTGSLVPDEFWTSISNEDFAVDLADNPEAHLKAQVLSAFGSWDSEIGREFIGSDAHNLSINDSREDDSDLLEIIGNEEVSFDDDDKANTSDEWLPYENKTLFLLDTIDNLPRIRISDSVMQMIIWTLRQSGVRNVPSLKKLRNCQKELREKSGSGIATIPCRSPQGNVFYMNDIRQILTKDWTDPDTRPHIHVYPEIPEDGIVSEVYHGDKWRFEMNRHVLSPMYDLKGVHYYIDELSELGDGRLIIPVRWLTFKGKVYADAYLVTLDNMGIATVQDDDPVLIDAGTLVKNLLDLQDLNLLPEWAQSAIEKGYPAAMPNPDRKLAGGDPLYSSFVDFFCDDVSGNRSKAWNKHWNIYITHRNLPRKLVFKEHHIHFISTSQYASANEQFHSLKKIIESTHKNPLCVQDGSSGQNVRFRIYGHAGTSDNPAQSEICSHIGGRGRCKCRKCNASVEKALVNTDAEYTALFEKGTPRSKEEILSSLQEQVKWAYTNATATRIEDMQTNTGVKDAYTQYWIDELIKRHKAKAFEMPDLPKVEIIAELKDFVTKHEDEIYSGFLTLEGFDPTKDTPVEILHTILLGIVKYIWYSSHSNWNADQKATYALRLQSTDQTGLSVQPIRANYIMQYANSLIGRQLKTVIQSSIFHIYDLVDENILCIWRAVGELSALLWYPEIKDMCTYLEDVDTAAQNVLDAFSVVDPKKITDKNKLLLLPHLVDDIRRFGPLVGVATERHEAWNSIFRFCSILSNHLAPSQDIAWQLAAQEGLKQRLSNGLWYCPSTGEWQRSSPKVREFVKSQPILQRLLGWEDPKSKLCIGSVKLKSMDRKANQRERATEVLGTTKARVSLNSLSFNMDSIWNIGSQLISQALDECPIGSWVVARSPIHEEPVVGRINAILEETNSASPKCIAILELFHVGSDRHKMFGMPILTHRDGEETFLIVNTKDVKFVFNVQHDCQLAQCEASGLRHQQQEREDSDIQESYVEHKSVDAFIINLHSFHNAHLIREVLPRRLTQPLPLFKDAARVEKHKELAQKYRALKEKSEAEAAARRAKKRKEQQTE